jgi:hypothetical protein
MPSQARIAGVSGLVALAAILIVEVVVPSAVAGPPLSGTLDRDAIAGYYAHPGLEFALGLGLFLVAVPAFVVFAITIRELARNDERARYLATLGGAFALVAASVYLVKGAIAAALVAVVGSGLDPVPLFRVYDLVYNGAIYPFEAAYVLCLGLAIVLLGAAPAWLRRLTIATSAILLLNTFVVWLGLPSAVALPGNLAFSLWLGSASVAIWRLEPMRATSSVPMPA